MVVLQDHVVSISYDDFGDRGVEIMRWIYDRLGRDNEVWQYYTFNNRTFFAFAQRDIAMLFKLTWGCGT